MGGDSLPRVALSTALAEAVSRVRTLCGDRWEQVRVVAPSAGSADLARRALGELGPFLRVRFSTVEVLLSELGVPALVRAGRAAEPAGWLMSSLEAEVRRLAEAGQLAGYGKTLCRPGWGPTLETALRQVEQARLRPAQLREIDAPEGVRERLVILADLAEAIAAQREAAGLYARTDVHVAAKAASTQDGLPVHRDQATVVIGDRSLPPAAFEAFEAWCESRPRVRVALHPLENLPPAPHGIRLATGDAETIHVPRDDGPSLRRLVFSMSTPEARPTKAKVEAVRNLDEHREVRAAVRRALDAIHGGLALDRIAFVLPDPASAALLREALEEASIPATWLTGPPLATSGPARLLLHALSVSDPEASAVDWYRLLRTPTLRLRARLGPAAVRGRGRWRALLSELGIPRTTAQIQEGLEALQAGLDPDEDAHKLASSQALLQSISALTDGFHRWPDRAPFAEHVRAWATWLRTWASRRPERLAVETLLDGVGRAAGPELTRAEARHVLERLLGSTPWLGGRLDEPKVRVLPPMEMVGGAFDLVCVLGMSEGRFPQARSEDPLLTDAVVATIHEATGVRLDDADTRRENERRRFAATLTAAEGTLWLSAPAHELRTGRPLAPSTLLFDVKAALEGRSVSLAELEAWLERPDSDAVGVPHDERRAISRAERRLVQARRQAEDAAAALSTHAVARRLLALHRAVDRLRAQPDSAPLDAWTGRIDPGLLRERLEARTLTPGAVQRLVQSPHRFFFQDLLGAWSAQRLPQETDPTEPRWLRQAVQLALVQAKAWNALEADPSRWLDAVLAKDSSVPDLTDTARALVGARFQHDLDVVGGGAEALKAATPVELPETQIAGTPWLLAAQEVWRSEAAVIAFTRTQLNKKLTKLDHDFTAACASLVAAPLGLQETIGVGKAGRSGGPPTVGTGVTPHLAGALSEAVEHAYQLARAGVWPFAQGNHFKLEREAEIDAASDGAISRLMGQGGAAS